MRALGALLILGFLPAPVWAEAPSTKVSSQYSSEAGGAGEATSQNPTNSAVLSIDMSSGSKFANTSSRFGIDRLVTDYSRYLVTGRDGTSTALSKVFSAPEYVARAGVDVYFKSFSLSIDGSDSLGSSPFAGSSEKISAIVPVLSRGGKFALELGHAEHASPISYFVDPDTFQTRQRVTITLDNRAKILWEQILTERLKTEVSVSVVERPQTRPSNQGAEALLGYALSDRSSLIAKLGLTRELHSSTLYDEHGYFSASWAQLEYRLEPSYQWSLSGLLGTVLETETARGNLPEQKVGTDSVGLQVRTHRRQWELGFKALQSTANTGYRSAQVGGDFTWHI